MNRDLLPPVLRYLEECHPQTLLALGSEAMVCASAYRGAHADCTVGTDDPLAAQTGTRYDAAILIGCIEHRDKTAALALIARLRDAQATNLLLAAPIGPGWTGHTSHWAEQDFLALGMQVYQRLDCDAGAMVLYRYNIHDYKQVPDWLNSKYWAHPERWEP
ncbi:MAG TPA: DUF6231 family protein [Sulfuriferula sp.]|nr:DUF6231 family protein [Sulfuriferula sp.]